jgi:hypothetical protein
MALVSRFSALRSFILIVALSGVSLCAQKLELFPRYTEHTPAVPVYRIATGGVLHRFFDTSPVSPSGRYVALFRLPFENRGPKPGEAGEVVLVDLVQGTERVVAKSHGWEVQLGANVQWGGSDEQLFYNDVDPKDWSDFAVALNPFTGEKRRLGGTVFMASSDGRTLASYNLRASRYAQVGYGVAVPNEYTRRNIGPVEDDAIVLTDTATGQVRRVLTVAQAYRSLPALHIANPEAHEYYFFQVKWNPQGTRLLTTLQWTPRGGSGRRRSVITFRPDGSDVRLAVTPEQWARGGHHINWAPDGEHLTMNLEVDGKKGLELIRVRYDGTGLTTIFATGSGHPSLHREGRFVVTDAYPDEPLAAGDGTSPIRFLDTKIGRETLLARVFVSMTAGEMRVDPHPAWDRSGRFVVFNGYVGNTRNVFLADLGGLITSAP